MRTRQQKSAAVSRQKANTMKKSAPKVTAKSSVKKAVKTPVYTSGFTSTGARRDYMNPKTPRGIIK